MAEKGLLFVVSGFSGAGKGTLMKKMKEKYAEHFALSISATTRAPREGEIDGVHYFFKTREEFETMIKQGEFVEYAQYVGNYYGTPKAYVEQCLSDGKDVILEIEVQGGLAIKKLFPDAIGFWLTAPDATVLKQRLVGRGTETMDVIESRLKRAVEECDYMNKYDYLIVNHDIDETADEVFRIIRDSHKKMYFNSNFINNMKNDLENLTSVKGE